MSRTRTYRLLMANSAELMKLLDEADRRISKTGGTPHDEFWAQVNGKAQARTPEPHAKGSRRTRR
jgi:nickel-dependent lactate racemase